MGIWFTFSQQIQQHRGTGCTRSWGYCIAALQDGAHTYRQKHEWGETEINGSIGVSCLSVVRYRCRQLVSQSCAGVWGPRAIDIRTSITITPHDYIKYKCLTKHFHKALFHDCAPGAAAKRVSDGAANFPAVPYSSDARRIHKV